MSKLPEILKTTTAAESRFFHVEGLELRFSNGNERYFERVRGPAGGAVMIVPMLDDDTVLLIREYGAGVGRYVLGFPKGAVEDDEDVIATANRELMEEVGYGANELTIISHMSASPGYLGSIMQLIVARDLYEERLDGDEPEPIEVIPWKLNNVDALLAHEEFFEARSIAALLLIEREYKTQQENSK